MTKKKGVKVLIIAIVVLAGLIGLARGFFDWGKINEIKNKRTIKKEFQIEFPVETEQDLLEEYQERLADYKSGALSNNRADQVKGWLGLASLRKIVKDYKGTEQALLKAGELDPKSIVCFANLANLYHYFLEDYPRAERAYLLALENNANDIFNYIEASNLYRLKRGNLSRAEDMLLLGLKYNKNQPDLLLALATFYKETGDKEKALEYFEKAIGALPDRAELLQAEIDQLK